MTCLCHIDNLRASLGLMLAKPKLLKKKIKKNSITKHAQVVNSLPIEPGVLSIDSEFYRECPEQDKIEKEKI